MQLQKFHCTMLEGFLTDVEKNHGVRIHVGGILEYTDCDSELLRILTGHIIHTSAYCMHVKSNPTLWSRCIRDKQRILEKLIKTKEPFWGVCHCGVQEYVVPVFSREKVVGYLSAGGYRPCGLRIDRRLRLTALRYGFDETQLRAEYDRSVTVEGPPSESLRTAMGTLSILFSGLADSFDSKNVRMTGSSSAQRVLMQQVMEYLQVRYSKNVTMDDIARFCCCSKSYIQHLFRRFYKTTISAHLERLRMEKARMLLANSELSIEQVAYSTGYNDANYFSAVFSKNNEVSPSAYRRLKAGREGQRGAQAADTPKKGA